MHLTLLVPELIWPEPEDHAALDDLACPALNTLLARSRLARRPPQSFEATLTDAFGQTESAPYAAFRRLGEPGALAETNDACWLGADPVHLRWHQDRLILADSGNFDITLPEAQGLVDALNHHLPDLGRFSAATADRWYLQLAHSSLADHFDAPPLSTVAGRGVDGFLSGTTQARELRARLNEVQMLLHAHPVNQQRESSGLLPINSLWLWGAGKLPPRRETDFDGVWSAGPLARGLALAAGTPAHALPHDAAAFFEYAAPGTRHLIVVEDLLRPVQYENGEAYRSALAGVEKRWFAPLQAALASGQIKTLRLEASTVYAALTWESRRLDQLKVWQRPLPLVTVAQELAKGMA